MSIATAWRTSAWHTLLATFDNTAINFANALDAKNKKDPLWPVALGAVIGFVPSLVGVVLGSGKLGERLQRMLSKRHIKFISGAVLVAIGAAKLFSAFRLDKAAEQPTHS